MTPECRISFDCERGKWGYAFKYPGDNPAHSQAWIWSRPEGAHLAADPHDERVWQESGQGDERVWTSTEYKPGTVAERTTKWRGGLRRK